MKEKKLRVKFCLACKSFKIRYIHGLSNLFGIIPRMKCMECGLETNNFPILEITQKELEEKVKKMKKNNLDKRKKKIVKKKVIKKTKKENKK
jgi:hypothetical protein